MDSVEVYDIDRSSWRTINYISNKESLKLVHPGIIQITGKKIMIFGGIAPYHEDDEANQAIENG